MDRRNFLQKPVLAAALAGVALPAHAQGSPTVNWRLASSFPKTLEVNYGVAEVLSKRVAALTDGKFNIRVFAGGEIVPPLQVLDAVQNGSIQMAHSVSYYYFGKDETFAFDTTLPFGMTSRQHTAWMLYGGGMEATRELFKNYGIVNFLGGNSGTQMGGWFRKEIKTLNDLKGLKFRIGGFAGRVLQKLGVVAQQIPAGEIYQALEKGNIDAAEWIAPFDDEKLGLYKIAPYYYTPGWWEGSAQLSFYVGQKEWEALPAQYQAALEVASFEAHVRCQADWDARNPLALARLLKQGAKLRTFSKPIMDASFAATIEVVNETAARNPRFKTVFNSWLKFRNDQVEWFKVAEGNYANYIYNHPWKAG